MNAAERDPFLNAADDALGPLGFKRPKSKFEWKRKVDEANTYWIHFNFGLGVINPSCGVWYTDLATLVPKDVGVVCAVSRMLEGISGSSYSSVTAPSLLANHVIAFAIPELEALRDRSAVIRSLESDPATKWPVFDRSSRIRLLPLLLAQAGRLQEAANYLNEFERVAPDIDQQIPRYAVFAEFFRGTYAAS